MTTAVYHWWSYPTEPPPYANLRTPIIMSIATLRAVSDIPITVLDLSEHDVDWGDFPAKLGFEVRLFQPTLGAYDQKIKGWRHLSRIFDLNKLEFETIMYVDSDVFFLKNPEPLAKSPYKFCVDGWNTGFFYYNPSKNREFIDIFESYTKASIFSEDVRRLMKQYVNYDAWYGVWDEMIITYMIKHHPELFNLIPTHEHVTIRNLKFIDPNDMKLFHCNGTMMHNEFRTKGGQQAHSRGLICLLVREFYEKIQRTIEDLSKCFSPDELKYYLPQQFSIIDSAKLMSSLIDSTGHFHVKTLLERNLNLM